MERKNITGDMPQFLPEAMYLANSYTDMRKLRDQMAARIAGDWTYTKDMAIADLDSITVSYEGERVQSSNISNPTERIAMKLTDEYIAKKQGEMYRERDALIREKAYVDWKIEIVDTVVTNRLDPELERPVFRLLYEWHRTFKETERVLLKKRGKKIANRNIVQIKSRIWEHLILELKFSSAMDAEKTYLERLHREAVPYGE